MIFSPPLMEQKRFNSFIFRNPMLSPKIHRNFKRCKPNSLFFPEETSLYSTNSNPHYDHHCLFFPTEAVPPMEVPIFFCFSKKLHFLPSQYFRKDLYTEHCPLEAARVSQRNHTLKTLFSTPSDLRQTHHDARSAHNRFSDDSRSSIYTEMAVVIHISKMSDRFMSDCFW